MPSSSNQTSKSIVLLNRKRVKKLRKKGRSKSEIAQILGTSPCFVRKWWDTKEKQLGKDGRGWKKGKLRKYQPSDIKLIKEVRQRLFDEEYFYGSKAVIFELGKLDKTYPERFVRKVISTYCQTERRRKKRRGVAKYYDYPKQTILKLGSIIEEIDFVGKKYIDNCTKPIRFLAQQYIQPFKAGRIDRLLSESGQEALDVLVDTWRTFPIPDLLKVDNAFGIYHAGRFGERRLTKFVKTVLNYGISILFTDFGKAWNNGSVEGLNSVFGRKVWEKTRFTSLEQVNYEIQRFNTSYQNYISVNPENIKGVRFKESTPLIRKTVFNPDKNTYPFLYFLRQVNEDEERGEGVIDILRVKIQLPKEYIGLYTLSKLNINEDALHVLHEKKDKTVETVRTVKFKVC